MDNVEAFSYVLSDSFMSAVVLPIQKDTAFPTMMMFGTYNLHLAVLFASIGAFLGALLNIFIGRLLRLVSKDEEGTASAEKLNKIVFFMQKYSKLGLLFAWIPVFGAIFAFMVGFARVPYKDTILWILVGSLTYYYLSAFNVI